MHRRHHWHPLLGSIIGGVALALALFSTAPAQAATSAPAPRAAASAPLGIHCQPSGNGRHGERCAGPTVQQFSEGGCGFLQRCIYFNRSEQTYLIQGAKWIVQAALCAASIGLGCVAAGLVVEIAADYLVNRGGLCPTSKPKLRVQWFPFPQADGCVA